MTMDQPRADGLDRADGPDDHVAASVPTAQADGLRGGQEGGMSDNVGWHQDPADPQITRYWDGTRWSAELRWDGTAWVDPALVQTPPPVVGPTAPPGPVVVVAAAPPQPRRPWLVRRWWLIVGIVAAVAILAAVADGPPSAEERVSDLNDSIDYNEVEGLHECMTVAEARSEAKVPDGTTIKAFESDPTYREGYDRTARVPAEDDWFVVGWDSPADEGAGDEADDELILYAMAPDDWRLTKPGDHGVDLPTDCL